MNSYLSPAGNSDHSYLQYQWDILGFPFCFLPCLLPILTTKLSDDMYGIGGAICDGMCEGVWEHPDDKDLFCCAIVSVSVHPLGAHIRRDVLILRIGNGIDFKRNQYYMIQRIIYTTWHKFEILYTVTFSDSCVQYKIGFHEKLKNFISLKFHSNMKVIKYPIYR